MTKVKRNAAKAVVHTIKQKKRIKILKIRTPNGPSNTRTHAWMRATNKKVDGVRRKRGEREDNDDGWYLLLVLERERLLQRFESSLVVVVCERMGWIR